MEKQIKLADSDQCTGCGACKAICPKGAIAFLDDAEGFPSPVIDETACVRCGLCEKTCPALHPKKTRTIKAAYAAQLLDSEALKQSTSGGIFTALSREVFRRDGVVYGCVWDEHYNAVIQKAENEVEMRPMRGSKYVWSWAGDTFPEIKAYLESGRTVLFTGMPCQVAGLKNYLGKDYDRLYLVDFFCGGSPSPFAFREYIKTITKKVPLQQLDFKFRDKADKGVGVHITYHNEAGGKTNQSYVKNPYFFAYHTKIFHRSPCYHCQYRYEKRIEDITIGDYWGIGQYHTVFNIHAGVSAVLINSERGAELFDCIKNQLLISETEIPNIARENNLTTGDRTVLFINPAFRDGFFNLLKTKGWTAAEYRYLYNGRRLKLTIKQLLPPRVVRIIKNTIRGRRK